MKLLILLFLSTHLVPTDIAWAATPEDKDFRGFIDQAKFQIRNEYWDSAAEVLERATQHPDGRIDPEAWFLLAQVRYQLGDLPGSQKAADKALTYSRDLGQTEATANFLNFVNTQFGLVRIEPSQPGMQAQLHPEFDGTFFDPELKRWVDDQNKRLKKHRVLLPTTIGLPVGKWNINGHDVQVKSDERVTMQLLPSETQLGGSAAARLAWLEVSAGVSTWIGGGSHYLPSADTQIGLSLPVSKRVVVGVLGHWTPTTMRLDNAQYTVNPRSVTVGTRVGLTLASDSPLVLRPSVGYRFGTVPGLRLSCKLSDESLICGDGPEDVALYTEGTAHVPFVELSLDYQDQRRTSWVGGGVKLIAERAFATAPKEGISRGLELPSSNEPLVFTVQDTHRRSSMYGARVLMNLSMAF
ncbi:MAG: hypothetical protein ACI9MC_001908 [Kiritimatiellia bacterium]|jgi:hypothetical protein